MDKSGREIELRSILAILGCIENEYWYFYFFLDKKVTKNQDYETKLWKSTFNKKAT